MASPIVFSGLSSGIDTENIITQLMSLEERPKLMLEEKVNLYELRKDVYSTLSAKLSALEDLVGEFKSLSNPFFSQRQAISSNESFARAVITGSNPAMGNYSLNITQLATVAAKSSSAALFTGSEASARAAIINSGAAINLAPNTIDPTQSLASQAGNFIAAPSGNGIITINGHNINWNDSMSLTEVIGAINNAGAGVTASFDAINQTFRIASIATGDDAEVVLGETSGNLLAGLDLTAGTAQGADANTTQFSVAVGDPAANLDTAATTGTFTINGVTFSVNAATDTLQTILSRINASGAGVNASYDENSGKISLQQKESGSANKIVLGAVGDTSNILYALKLSGNNPPVGGAPDTYSGQDAMVSVNGQAAQAVGSNSAQGLIPGVSVELLALGNVSITVQDDVDGMVDTIKDFVNQYNDIMNYINTKMDEERVSDPSTLSEKLQGAFRSDRLFYQTKIDLAKIITDAVSGLPGTMNQMAQIGITTTSEDFGKSGTLELDEEKLRAALETNPDGVKNLFNDSGEGIMTQLSKKLDAYTNSVSGSFTTNATMIDDQVEYLTDRISDWELRLEAKEKSLRMEFAAMESAISQLNSMGNALANALGQNSSSASSK